MSVPIPAKEKYSTTTWEKVPPDPFEDNSKNGSVSNSNPFQPVNNNGQQPIVIPAIVKPSLQTGTTGINPALLAVAQSNSQAQGQSAGGYQIQPPFAIPSAAGAGTGQSSPSLIAVPGGIPVGGFPPNWSVETAQVAAGQGVNYQIPSQGGYQVAVCFKRSLAKNNFIYANLTAEWRSISICTNPSPVTISSISSFSGMRSPSTIATTPSAAEQWVKISILFYILRLFACSCYRCPRRTKKAKALASKTQQQEDQKPSEKVNNESQNSTNSIKEDDSSISTNRQQCTSTELKSILKKV